nr:zinc finger MYM-type protein 1-like [Tanacetum cinerariifolium]
MNRYMLQKLDRAEEKTRLLLLPFDEPFKTFSVQTPRLSSESDTRISNILEAAREKVLVSIYNSSFALSSSTKVDSCSGGVSTHLSTKLKAGSTANGAIIRAEKLHADSNGNFWGLIEMLEEFDPFVKEHMRRITSDEIHIHYLRHSIKNELIQLLARGIKSQIIQKIKQANYFSVIFDCTPDTSHQEQMSLILRYVNVGSTCVLVEESFLGFLSVDDTNGQGLFDVTRDELKSLDLDIDNVCGQGYDNGSNMKGKHRGVQKKFLDINPRAFYTPCGCHSINLTLCDIASSCGKAMDFFGVIQRIYTMFANSSKRWLILKNNVKGLSLKPLSIIRWESHVESVKAIRFQLLEIREALLQVADTDNDSKIKSESKSLATNEEIGIEMDIDPVFRQKRVIRRKRQFDENSMDEETTYSVEEAFKVQYFLYIVDQALLSLRTRFKQYKEYERVFGFLFISGKLNSLDDNTLKSHCSHLEAALKNNEQSDVDANDLFVKLRVLLTIPVTVASAERSFSKLKLLKSYLRSTMSQERLNGLALIAIENRLLESVDYEDLINNFASKNARRIALAWLLGRCAYRDFMTNTLLGNISEIKGLRRRVRDLEIQHEIRQIRKRIRELKLQREMRKETESRYVVRDDVNEEEEYPSFDSYPRSFEPIYPDIFPEDEPRFDEEDVNTDYEEAPVFDDDPYEAETENIFAQQDIQAKLPTD